MRLFKWCLFLLLVVSCVTEKQNQMPERDSMDSSVISAKAFRTFKVLDSKYLSNAEIWESLNLQLKGFTAEKYSALKPLILEKDIPTLQEQVSSGRLSYELLTKFYLYRIR
ncbi:hypothetical protein [Olleya sp. HaHaR_3_96]|uniref:hypothetical protein n=1 Tax=Olleya sp. HaHaR_3_96 TaxID=2745560 RepID=UPI00211A58F0|nr:hypothetical protein [Olleya sp. HaHaR_3_96]